jgi:hypothetical protein
VWHDSISSISGEHLAHSGTGALLFTPATEVAGIGHACQQLYASSNASEQETLEENKKWAARGMQVGAPCCGW